MWLNKADLQQSDFAEMEKLEPNVTRFEDDPKTPTLNVGWGRRIYTDAELGESCQAVGISEVEQKKTKKKRKSNKYQIVRQFVSMCIWIKLWFLVFFFKIFIDLIQLILTHKQKKGHFVGHNF